MATIEEALTLAVQHHQAGRLAEADGIYLRILDVKPDQPDALHLHGLILARSGRMGEALETIGRALRFNPGHAQAHHNLGNLLEESGRRAEAAEHHAAAARLSPGWGAAHAALGRTLAALGRREEAAGPLARAAALNGQDANLFVQLADLLLSLGRHEQAVRAARLASALVPANPRALLMVARLLMPLNRYAEMETALNRAACLDPADLDVQTELGRLLEALRSWNRAADALARVAAARPDDAPLHLRLGTALRNANRDGEAASAFRAAAHGDADAACQLGLIERQAGRLEEAVAAFRAAIALKPNHSPSHFHLGLTLRLLGRGGEAFADPEGRAPAHAAHAAGLAAGGRLKDACAHYHEALLFRPGLEEAERGLAAVLAERRRLCRYGEMPDKEHTDEWGNIALYEAMAIYNRTLAADPRLAGVAGYTNGAGVAGHTNASGAVRPRVFDGFTVYNELDLLELRLEELWDEVDAFIAVEAPWTFQGKPKPLILRDNLDRFARFSSKLVHVVVEQPEAGPSPWDREQVQRNAIMQGLAGRAAPDDVVLIGDVDEIPNARTVAAIRNDPVLAGRLNRLSVDYYCGFLDFRCNYKWHKPIALPYRLLAAMGPDLARFMAIAKYGTLLYDAGWHFSWLGGIEKVIGKLKSYAHSEYTRLADEGPERIREALGSGRGIFALMDDGHGYGGEFKVVPLDDSFPAVVRRDPERFRRLGWFYESMGEARRDAGR